MKLEPSHSQKNTTPLPADPLGVRFCQYFNHGWNFIFAPVPAPGEKPDWLTESAYPLQPRNLWQQYLNPHTLLGVRFGSHTRYLMLDVDRGSLYHPTNDPIAYRSLLACLEEIGLVRPVAITSSSSDGIHIYYFFPKPLSSFALAKCVWLALTDARFKVRDGQIELYPNAKAYKKDGPSDYKAHRLPLQAGSYLLNDDLEIVGNYIGQFLDFADLSAAGQALTQLEEAIALAKSRKGGEYRPGASTRAEVWKQDLEHRISEGWTGPGQTNALLKDFACYGIVWRALDGEALIDFVVVTALAAPGYQQWCSHQHEIRRRAAEWSQCCEGFYVKYCGHPNRQSPYKEQFGGTDNTENNIVAFRRSDPNVERHQQTFERIRSVVAHLETAGTLPAAATARSAAIIVISKELHGIGVSQTTLHKQDYLPLWHPKHYLKLGVIATSEPISAVSSELEIEQIPDPWLEPKSLKAAPLRETETNYTLPSLMKVRALPAVSDEPQAQSDALLSSNSSNLLKSSEATTHKEIKCQEKSGAVDFGDNSSLSVTSSSIDLTPNDATPAPVETDKAATEPDDRTPLTPLDHKQIAMLRLQAIATAQRSVKNQALTEARLIRGKERTHLEQVARMQFYCQSGEPSLMAEAREWASAHPGASPKALCTADSSSGNLAADPPLDETPTLNPTEPAPHLLPTADSEAKDSSSALAEKLELPTKPSPTTSPEAKLKQPSNRRLQPVEILTGAGSWLTGYFVHSCIAVANLVGQERQFTLFDADGGTYSFVGQIRPLT